MANFSKIFRGKVINGNIKQDTPEVFGKYMHVLEGKRVEFVVRTPKKQRSNPQNGYYWGVVIAEISEHTGQLPDDVHDFLKSKFLREEVSIGDEVQTRVRASSGLSTKEWEEFMTNCRQWASEFLSLYIPEPNEVEPDATMYM